METKEIIGQAESWLGGEMHSSALVRLSLAKKALEAGNEANARRHALMSLQYSVGLMSPIYAKAARND